MEHKKNADPIKILNLQVKKAMLRKTQLLAKGPMRQANPLYTLNKNPRSLTPCPMFLEAPSCYNDSKGI